MSLSLKYPDKNELINITESDYVPPNFNASDLKEAASKLGEKYINNWLIVRKDEINKILSKFNADGTSKPTFQISATAFNDLYKWTMMPVIRAMEKSKPYEKVNVINVTFGIDFRDDRSKKLITILDFRKKLLANLSILASRKFDRTAFTSCLTAPLRDGLLDDETIEKICGPEGNPNPLANKVIDGKNTYQNDNNVRIYLYDTGANGWVVEATGPWHRVTWLETSLMQCVYQTMLTYDFTILVNHKQHNINQVGKKSKTTVNTQIKPKFAQAKTYSKWLQEALTRCAKSVAFTHLINSPNNKCTPALFTGRRTGGLAFLLLQNLFFADHFKQFSPSASNAKPKSKYAELLGNKEFLCLGTSSCESNYILSTMGLPCLNPAGTHAHELSMVASVLYPMLDANDDLLPYTQVIGHYLYYALSWRAGPVPMLPDTLGTCAFIRAAKNVALATPDETGNLKTMYDIISAARQDSGTLELFDGYMELSGYKGAKMASEIDDTSTLFEAAKLGYNTFGAGGFFGDGEKVWSANGEGTSYSMAVKAVRVKYFTNENSNSAINIKKNCQIPLIRNGESCPKINKSNATGINWMPHISIETIAKNNNTKEYLVTGYPVKLGDIKDDPTNKSETDKKPIFSAGVKLSIDKNISPELKLQIQTYAEHIRRRNYELFSDETNVDAKPKETKLISALLSVSANIKLPYDKLKGGKRKLVRKYPVKTKRAIAQQRNKRSKRAR